MHRKFQQNGGEPICDFILVQPGFTSPPLIIMVSVTMLTKLFLPQMYSLGQTVHDDHSRLSCDSRQLKQSEIDNLLRKSFTGIESVKIEFCGDRDEGKLPPDMAGLFRGFLAIGTLGSETSVTAVEETPTIELFVREDIPMLEFLVEDGTPIFKLLVEDIVAEKETEITENELNMINEELEKALLGSVAEEEMSSGRNSHVSAGRSSHASGGTTAVCPLQGYLLGSVVDVPGVMDSADATKKEQRTTLGELFQMTDEGTKEDMAKNGGGEDPDASSVMKFMKKKMMKKKLVHGVSASKVSGTGVPDVAASSENKLHKMLHIFQKKVYPGNETSPYKSHVKHKKVTFATEVMTRSNDKIEGDGSGISIPVTAEEEMSKLTENLFLKEKIRCMKRHGNVLAPMTVDGDESNGSRECWIKTDEEYLILELRRGRTWCADVLLDYGSCVRE